jgi:hypothetical protein
MFGNDSIVGRAFDAILGSKLPPNQAVRSAIGRDLTPSEARELAARIATVQKSLDQTASALAMSADDPNKKVQNDQGAKVQNPPGGPKVQNPPGGPKVQNPPGGPKVQNPPGGPKVQNPKKKVK